MIQSKRKKVLACLIGMSLAGSLTAMAAPELTAPLLVDGDKTVQDGTRVTVSNVYDALGIAGTSESTGTFTIGGGTGTLHINVTSASAGNSNASGILIGDDSYVTVNGNLDIKVYGQSCFANGIAMIREGTGQGKKATIAINGNLTIGDPSLKLTDSSDDRNWGVNAEEIHGGYGPDGHVSGQADNYTGARWQPVGVDIDMSGGSVIDLNGDVKLAIRGTALRTDPYYKAGTQHSYDLATINANRGNVTILTPTSTKESFYAAASYGGTININMNGNEAAGHVVNIKGNVLAMRDDNGSGQPYFYQDGRINLGLNTADSQWTGVVDNSGNKQAGQVNLWLQNGARWIHDAPSLPNGMQVNNMPYPSNGQYGKYKNVSYINKLTGGSGEGTAGIIHQNYTSDISIADYSGNTKVFYQHTLGSNSTRENAALYDNKEVNITGGKVTIGKAAAGSTITLITDSKGISDYQKGTHQYKNLVNDALGKLANKLYYSAYATAPTHLTAKVEVAEGLTASSRSLALGNVLFSTGSTGTHQAGQGYYNYTVTSTDDPGNFAFTQLITGDKGRDKTYVDAGILVDEGENYNFTQNTTITAVPAIDVWDGKRTVDGADQQGVDHEVNVNAKGQTLTVVSKEAMKRGVVSGINASSRKGVTVNADKLVIDVENMKGRAEGITVGGQGGKNKDDPYKLTINGDINMKVLGNDYALGLYAAGNSDVTFNGNVTALGDETGEWGLTSTYGAFGYYGVSLVYSGNNYTIQMGPKVTINGDVNAKIDGNGLFANGGHAKLTINGGGNIEINKNNAHNYYAMIAECGTTSMNVNLDGSYQAVDARNNDLILKGNIAASTGAINIMEPEQYTYVNLGLATNKSEWIGVAHNKFNDEGNTTEGKTFYGAINLWLQNGATWKHEKWGPTDDAAWGGKGFTESHLAKLTGGASADKAGVIYQNSAKQIRVDNYSGNTTVFYKHEEANPQTINGGDFKITNAAEGSAITLVTDSKGITAGFEESDKAADKNNVSEVLNKLANKLWYTSYTDNHLKGTVKIAEGLTASSATKKLGDVSFSTSSTGTNQAGQGYYKYTPAEDQTGRTIYGLADKDAEYVRKGIRQADGTYKFTSDYTVSADDRDVTEENLNFDTIIAAVVGDGNDVTLDASGHTLTLKAKSTQDDVDGVGLYANKKAGVTAKQLNIEAEADKSDASGLRIYSGGDVTIHGNVSVKVRQTADGKARGIQFYNSGDHDDTSKLTINGSLTMKGDDGGYGVSTARMGKYDDGTYYAATGIYIDDEKGASLTVIGDTDISVKGRGIDIGSLEGKGKNVIDLQGKTTILTPIDLQDKSGSYELINGESGTLYIGMNKDKTGASGKEVVLQGLIYDKNANIRIGLGTADSKLTGYIHKDEGGNGTVNLHLKDGGIWHNEATTAKEDGFKGSRVTRLSSDKGVVFQNDTNPIQVDTYSGNMTVIYKHEIVDDTARGNASLYGNKAASIIGGDFKITNAAEGSTITLLTDSLGVNTTSTDYKDQNLVYDLMDKLAGKLYYSSYADGHLKGIVKISDGLTASSMMLKMGDISYSTDNTGTKKAGQGYYQYDAVYPSKQVTNPIDKVIDGSEDSKNAYRNDGVYHDKTDSYDFTSNPADVTAADKDDGVIHASDNNVNVTTKEWLNVTAKDGGVGVAAENGKTVTTEGNTKITADKGIGVKADGGIVSMTGDTVIQAGTGMEAFNGGTITAGSKTNITAEKGKNALHASGDGSSITLQKGTINGAVLAENKGAISTNGAELKGKVTASSKGSLTLTGGSTSEGIIADGGKVSTNDTAAGGILSAANGGSVTMTNGSAKGLKADENSRITAKLDKEGASINGDIANEGNVTVNLSNGAAWTGDSTGSGSTSATIGKGSAWTGKSANEKTDIDLAGTWKQTGDSTVATLHSMNGTLDKSSKDSGKTDIGHASGTLNLIYSHDEQNPNTIYGGDTTIGSADAGTAVNLITDSKGVKASGQGSGYAANKNKVSETLNQMAHKLIYTANDGNITGKLKIAEGLTSSSASLRAEDLSFDENGRGFYKYDPEKDNDITIEFGSEETQMMRGTKSALLGVVTIWRSNNNDLQRRLGDVRIGQEESGAWARYVGGKNKFDEQNTYMSQSYDIGQAGYDKKMGSWIAGIALDYAKGDVSYTGGKGKERMTTLALYGTRAFDDGRYLDVIVKTGKLKNEFDVSNEIGNKLKGDYSSWGNSFSVEYGRRFVKDNGFYLDPSVEITAGRVNAKDFTGHSDLGELYVKQHAFDSVIGRIGLGIGRQTDKSNAYMKLALAHEFSGSFQTDFFAKDGGLKSTKIDLSDTWLDLEVGGSISLGKGTYLYGTYTHNFGAKLETKWRADVGVRYTF